MVLTESNSAASDQFLGENLIFVISQPRSGSTLLQRVLAGHPEILTSAETWLMLHPIYGTRSHGLWTEYGADFRLEAVDEFLSNYSDGSDVIDQAIRAWAEVVYGNVLQHSGRTIFLDKTPRYFYIIPDLVRLFPRAKFIFLLRNPMAVLFSELTTYVKGDWPVLSVFGPDLVDAPELILDGRDLLGPQAITVRYEDFVEDPETSTANLCKQLGISYVDNMVEYDKTPAPVGKMNDPVGIHQHTRPSPTSVDRWKALAEDPQSAHFAHAYLEELGRDILTRMGYCYDEIYSSLGLPATATGPDLFPWEIAIKPRDQWSFREWLIAEKHFAIRDRGTLRGNVRVLRAALRRWRFNLRSAMSNVADG